VLKGIDNISASVQAGIDSIGDNDGYITRTKVVKVAWDYFLRKITREQFVQVISIYQGKEIKEV